MSTEKPANSGDASNVVPFIKSADDIEPLPSVNLTMTFSANTTPEKAAEFNEAFNAMLELLVKLRRIDSFSTVEKQPEVMKKSALENIIDLRHSEQRQGGEPSFQLVTYGFNEHGIITAWYEPIGTVSEKQKAEHLTGAIQRIEEKASKGEIVLLPRPESTEAP